MLNKKYLNKVKVLLKYNFSMKWFAILIPYLIVFPLCLLAFRKYGMQPQTEEVVIRYTQFFIPVTIILLLLPLMNNYVGANKNEVLFLHHKLIVTDIIICVAIYFVILTPLYLMFTFLMDISFAEFVRILIEVFFFSSLTYLLCFLFNSVIAGYLMIFIYYFLSIMVLPRKWFVFFNMLPFGKDLFFEVYLYLFIVSLALFLLAVIVNKYVSKV